MPQTTLSAEVKLDSPATRAVIDQQISEIMKQARDIIGCEPRRAFVIVDRTGSQTVVRAILRKE